MMTIFKEPPAVAQTVASSIGHKGKEGKGTDTGLNVSDGNNSSGAKEDH